MEDDGIKKDMRRWGNAKVARLAELEDGHSAGDNILAKQTDLGLASRLKRQDEREILGRDGRSRRRYMACKASSHALRMNILPMWAVDPIPARNDAGPPRDCVRAVVDLVPEELRWVDRALARLSRDNPIREKIVREEFCGNGTQKVKAKRVASEYGGTLTVRQYRYELQRALDCMTGMRVS